MDPPAFLSVVTSEVDWADSSSWQRDRRCCSAPVFLQGVPKRYQCPLYAEYFDIADDRKWPKGNVTLSQQVAVTNRDKSAIEVKATLQSYRGVSLMASTYRDRAITASSGTNLQGVAESMPQMKPKPNRAQSGWSLTGSCGRRHVDPQAWKRSSHSALSTPRPNPCCAGTSSRGNARYRARAHRRLAP